jgi:hypothetical protein
LKILKIIFILENLTIILLFVEILLVKKKGHGTCNLQLFPPSFSLENTKKFLKKKKSLENRYLWFQHLFSFSCFFKAAKREKSLGK